jgi:hypothetical protein
MLAKILPFLNKALPTGLAIKGIEKINPGLGDFLSGAFGAGYTADQALDFLRDKLETPGNKGVHENLEQRQAQGMNRPDQAAALKSIRESKEPANVMANAITGGAALAGGLGAIGKLKGTPSKDIREQAVNQQQQEIKRPRQNLPINPDEGFENEQDQYYPLQKPGINPKQSLSPQNAQEAMKQNIARARPRSPVGREALQEDIEAQSMDQKAQILQGLREIAARLGA